STALVVHKPSGREVSSSSSVVWTLWRADVGAGQRGDRDVCGTADAPADRSRRRWIRVVPDRSVHGSGTTCPWTMSACPRPSTGLSTTVHCVTDDMTHVSRRYGLSA